MRFFETLGIPGSGKSTLTRAVGGFVPVVTGTRAERAVLAFDRGLAAMGVGPKISGASVHRVSDVAGFVTRYPGFAATTLEVAAGIQDERQRSLSVTWALRDWARRTRLERVASEGADIWLDEGSIHRLTGLLQRQGGESPHVEQYLNSLPPIDGLIYVSIQVEVAHRRTQNPGRIGWRGSLEALHELDRIAAKVADAAASSGVDVLRLDGMADTSTQVAEVSRWLAR